MNEFIDGAWIKNKEQTPSISAVSHRFNLVTDWVATMILMQPQNRQRVKTFKTLLAVCKVFLLHTRRSNIAWY
jgi:hypothetical protein